MSSRRRNVPTEGSWRLVDGDNDSFDTRYLSSFDEDDQPHPMHPQYSFSASQGLSSFNDSQDSIRDFTNHQDDEQVILREPFRPTVPASVTSGSTSTARPRPPDVQLRMPRVDVDSDLTSSGGGSVRTFLRHRRSSDAISTAESEDSCPPCRAMRRRRSSHAPPDYRNNLQDKCKTAIVKRQPETPSVALRRARLLLSYLIIPLLGVAVYLASSGELLKTSSSQESRTTLCSVDFNPLVATQAKFQSILQKGRVGASLPFELEGSEIATRNLRSLLKDGDASSKAELMPEVNGYIEKVGRASPDLATFYIHIGSTVDSVININRWTLRHVSSLSVEPEAPELPAAVAWATRVVRPFRASQQDANDRALMDKHTEHIVLIQDRLERLADEGAALALLLSHSHQHLKTIRLLSSLSSSSLSLSAAPRANSLLSGLWSYIGVFISDEQRDVREQLDLLAKVDAQYAVVTAHVRDIIADLKLIHAEFEHLLRRSADPPVVWTDESASMTTLTEQIDVVRSGLRQLEHARRGGEQSG